MNSLDPAPVAAPVPAWGTPLTREELDSTVGGVDFLSLAILFFGGGLIIGIIDRWLFGGCQCA